MHPTSDARVLGLCDQTYYRWKAQSGGLEVSEARRLPQLEDENRRLKRIVADLPRNPQRRC